MALLSPTDGATVPLPSFPARIYMSENTRVLYASRGGWPYVAAKTRKLTPLLFSGFNGPEIFWNAPNFGANYIL
jgi:hypothetical protein